MRGRQQRQTDVSEGPKTYRSSLHFLPSNAQPLFNFIPDSRNKDTSLVLLLFHQSLSSLQLMDAYKRKKKVLHKKEVPLFSSLWTVRLLEKCLLWYGKSLKNKNKKKKQIQVEGTQTTSFNIEPQHGNKQRRRKYRAGKQGAGATN